MGKSPKLPEFYDRGYFRRWVLPSQPGSEASADTSLCWWISHCGAWLQTGWAQKSSRLVLARLRTRAVEHLCECATHSWRPIMHMCRPSAHPLPLQSLNQSDDLDGHVAHFTYWWVPFLATGPSRRPWPSVTSSLWGNLTKDMYIMLIVKREVLAFAIVDEEQSLFALFVLL